MNETDDELKQWTYEDFCAPEYHDQFVELLARGWTDEKLLRAYDDAVEEWQRVGHEGKPPISSRDARAI
jgi:hypothetical protein